MKDSDPLDEESLEQALKALTQSGRRKTSGRNYLTCVRTEGTDRK